MASGTAACDFNLLKREKISFLIRFGKHRKDESPGERMERKGSSKSRAGDGPTSLDDTVQMRLEQERSWSLNR
ncbi:unnamed protein product [Arctogadus glacialis]